MSADVTWQALLQRASGRIDARDARALAAFAAGIAPGRMTLHMHDKVDAAANARFEAAVDARAAGRPVSKILGARLFWGRSFRVTDDVLDPRGDTETLIAACLELKAPRRGLDLGTGSGAIGLTLAAEWPDAQVVCTDVSEAALAVAGGNARALGVADRVQLLRSDWFADVRGQFDLIVSNPPYIALSEWDALDLDVREFDPRQALTDEGDGLSAYRTILAGAPAVLAPDGTLAFEIGWQQGPDVAQLCRARGFADVQVLPDLAGRDRCVMAKSPQGAD